jgi:hypothetical protein
MKENAGGKNIDFFFLDREGMNISVLRSLDFREFLLFIIFGKTVR